MRTPRASSSLAVAVLFPLLLTAKPIRAQDFSFDRDLATWRAQHTMDLQKPDGWLSLIGLAWLQSGDNSFGAAADNKIHLPPGNPEHLGILRLDGTTVTLQPPAGGFPAGLLVDGQAATQRQLPMDPDRGDQHNPRMTVGTLNMYVVNRGDRFALRIKDAKSPAMTSFHGLRWYSPNAAFRLTAHWIPYDPPKPLTLTTLIGTTYTRPVPGAAEFSLAGAAYRLEPILEDPEETRLFFVVTDPTSKTKSYRSCRFLYTGFPSNGLQKPGELVLDFNRLENPPCAYTAFATCPLPPKQNRLTIALPVGEQRYHE